MKPYLVLMVFGISGQSWASSFVLPPIPERMSEPALSAETRKVVQDSFRGLRDSMREGEGNAPSIPAMPASIPEASFSPETRARLEDAFARIAFVKPEALSSLVETAVGTNALEEVVVKLGVAEPVVENQNDRPQALIASTKESTATVPAIPSADLPPNLLVEQAIALQQELSAEPSLFQRVHGKYESLAKTDR